MEKQTYFRAKLRGESNKQWVNTTLEASKLGRIIDTVELCFSLVLVLFVIYTSWEGPLSKPEPQWMEIVTLAIASLFLFMFCLRLFAADNRLAFLCSLYTIIDILTIFPILLKSPILQLLGPFPYHISWATAAQLQYENLCFCWDVYIIGIL